MTSRLKYSIFFPVSAVLFFVMAWPEVVFPLVNTWAGFFPALLLFLFFSVGILGWGVIWGIDGIGGWAGVLLNSTLILFVFSFLLAHFAFLNFVGVCLSYFYLVGGLFCFLDSYQRGKVEFPAENKGLLLLFGFPLFVRMFSGFLPLQHGDPLLYHLLGPRLWVRAGQVKLDPDFPLAFLASSWEYLYLLPQLIFTQVPDVRGLIAGQIFGQWIHLTLGWIGCAILMERLIRKREREFWNRALAVCAAIFTASIQWTGGVAKNDCGIALWSLGSLLLLQEGVSHKSRKILFFAGCFAGLAFVGKISSVLFLGPFLAVFGLWELWHKKTSTRLIVQFLLAFLFGFLLFSIPILFRMYIATGNPFFPMFNGFFPTRFMSQTLQELFAPLQPNRSLGIQELLLNRTKELLHESPFVFLCLLIFPLSIPGKFQNCSRNLWLPLFSAVLVFVLFVLGFGAGAEFRYINATLFYFPLIGTLLILRLAEHWIMVPVAKRNLFVLCSAVILLTSHIPTHLLWRFPKIAPGEAHLLTHTAGDAKAWLRKNANAIDDQILILSENEGYYLSQMNAVAANNRMDTDAAILGNKSFLEFLRKICEVSHAKYFLDSKPAMGLPARFTDFVGAKEAIVFQGAEAKVYDLDLLVRKFLPDLTQGCGHK